MVDRYECDGCKQTFYGNPLQYIGNDLILMTFHNEYCLRNWLDNLLKRTEEDEANSFLLSVMSSD